MKEKKPPSGPILKRDENNQLDRADAKAVNDELMIKFMREQRLHEKEESFNLARGHRRDIAVHLSVTILPRVDGHTVVGEVDKEFNQWCFVLPASALPMKNSTLVKALSELAHVGKQALMKLGMVREG